MTEPLFSIVVPTRNRYDTARKTIESVLTQNHGDFELIVSDNSTDGDLRLGQWLERRAAGRPDVHFVRTGGHLDMDDNWESASRLARGKYLLVLPDRWVMRGGALNLLASLVDQQEPECVFWDSKLSMDGDGRLRNEIDTRAPIRCKVVPSERALENLLDFKGYLDNTVYTQPFPRGLNCIIRQDVVVAIRRKVGSFFAPNACDYTSGVSVLLNTRKLTHVGDSLYLSLGNDSNGEKLAVYGVPEKLRPATAWRGLQLDTVLLTVMNDIEDTLRRNGAPEWSPRIDHANVLLSLLAEIHFKEWHGSPLDTVKMKQHLLRYAEANKERLGANIAARLAAYDAEFSPSLPAARRWLQKWGCFYALYRCKNGLARAKRKRGRQFYSQDFLSGRQILLADSSHT